MHKPLHDMTDAEAIAAYGTEPTHYESVGQWQDSGDMDHRYAEKRHGGMNHYAAKVQSYEEVMGREYPYDRPVKESARDQRILKQYAHEQQVKNINQKHNAELRQLKDSLGKKRMAGILIAAGLAGTVSSAVMDAFDVNNFSLK